MQTRDFSILMEFMVSNEENIVSKTKETPGCENIRAISYY